MKISSLEINDFSITNIKRQALTINKKWINLGQIGETISYWLKFYSTQT